MEKDKLRRAHEFLFKGDAFKEGNLVGDDAPIGDDSVAVEGDEAAQAEKNVSEAARAGKEARKALEEERARKIRDFLYSGRAFKASK